MKVLHINKSAFTGGAALAAVRLVTALRDQGVDAQMLTLEEEQLAAGISPLLTKGWQQAGKMFRFAGEALVFRPRESGRISRFAFSPGRFGYDISRHPLVNQADVLHLHWINQGFLSLTGLHQLINLGKPIVWTLHDMWPFTGGCHYSGDCLRFSSGCGKCPLLKNSGKRDLSWRQFAVKRDIYGDARITWVGCSRWMSRQVGLSGLLGADPDPDIRSVFNPIDTHLFVAGSKEEARRSLQLPVDKKLILFGAANLLDPRKGVGHLVQALHRLNQMAPALQGELELVVFGKNAGDLPADLPYRLHTVDFVETQQQMARLYRAADVFVLPSMQDNLPNTVMESLSCGTPVAAFRVGGVPEMIEHQQWGVLAAVGDEQELAEGILYLLTAEGSELRASKARLFVEKYCSPDVVAKQYNEIYQSVI